MATFVVTGTGRCGTAHCWRTLEHIGVPAAHEEFFHLDRRSFDAADARAYDACPSNDVSLMAAPFLRQLSVPVIHIVRNPIDTVNSFLHMRLDLRQPHVITDYINHWIKLEGETNEDLWADYWVKWNRLCAESAALTLRMEALSEGAISDAFIEPIVGESGFVAGWCALGATPNRYHAVTSNIVPARLVDRLQRAGEEYGYTA